MEQITHKPFQIAHRKQNPATNIFSELRKFGIKDGQIKGLIGRYEISDLRAKLIETKKLTFPNLPALFLKVKVKELPRKPKKPRQMALPRIIKRRRK